MLTLPVVLEIRRLLEEGELSQRTIAAKMGVSRSTVSALANGRRGWHGRQSARSMLRPSSGAALPQRCPDCGGLVFMPCRLCRLRTHWQQLEAARKMPAQTSPRPAPDPRRAA